MPTKESKSNGVPHEVGERVSCACVYCCVHVHVHVRHVYHVYSVTVNMLCFYVVSTQPSNVGNPVESVCFILGYGEEVDKSDIRCI